MAQFDTMKNLLFTLPFLVFSCNLDQKSPVVGGPCSYKTTYHPARVVGFDSSQMDALFEVNLHGKPDTFGYHELNNAYLTPDEVKTTGFAVGNIYRLAHDGIESGTCTPVILRLELVPSDSTTATAK